MRARVLIVDDEPRIRDLLREELTDHGLDVECAPSGKAAVAALGRTAFDLVVTDVRMTGMTGLDLTRWVAENQPSVDVVLMTGFGSLDTATEAMRAGAADYLLKPFGEGKLLLATIDRVLEKRELAAEARELRARLVHADRLAGIGRLAAALAHEISNPAAYVMGNLYVLQERIEEGRMASEPGIPGADVGELAEMVAEAMEGITRIARTVADLKAFSGADGAETEPVVLSEPVRSAANVARCMVRHHAVLDVSLGDVPPIPGRRGQLAQVALNLLMSVTDAFPPRGNPSENRVEVGTRADDADVVLSLRVDGPVLLEEYRRQLEGVLCAPWGHEALPAGSGLSLVREIVADHGGTTLLRCDAPGILLEVRLPLGREGRAASEQTPAAAGAPLERASTTRPRALVIDDEPFVARTFARMLGSVFDVDVAPGGAAAFDALEANDYDAIVCDLMMPDIDGVHVWEHL